MRRLVMQRWLLYAAAALSCTDAGAAAEREPQPAAESCVTGDCDPLCVEAGRYRTTPELVVDTRNQGRTWQRRATMKLPHAEAQRYCENLVIDGMRGFRLPAPEELGSLRYKAGGLFGGGHSRHYCVPSIDQAAFPETPAAEFWTSRVMPDGTAMYMGFDDGRMHRDVLTDALWVRCVR
jgi:hypothetical protein